MELLLNSLIIFASWNIGKIFAGKAKKLAPVRDIAGIVFAAVILVIVTVMFPAIKF